MSFEDMTLEMKEIYLNYKFIKSGNDKGEHIVYHIGVPSKHRGIHQGYVGCSYLNIEGVIKRYSQELIEIDKGLRNKRKVHSLIQKYKNYIEFKVIASGLTKEEALEMEASLRPHKKGSVWNGQFNWNSKAGG